MKGPEREREARKGIYIYKSAKKGKDTTKKQSQS
jgi:hypothetical protein